MLSHYSKAITCLEPHCSSRYRASVRVALITCVIFVCLELLRGHYQTAQAHLRSGVELLKAVRSYSNTQDDGCSAQKPSLEPVDDHIAEALSSLHTRIALFNAADQSSYFSIQSFEPELPCTRFKCINHAKNRLDLLFNRIFFLAAQARQQAVLAPDHHPPSLLRDQQHLLDQLSSWLSVYTASKTSLQSQDPLRNDFAYLLLLNHHKMAYIMASTCLYEAQESRFDAHTADFISIITRSINLYQIVSTKPVMPTHYGYHNVHAGAPNSVIEIGWIPPLYYVALKCRVHRIRLHAIQLLELSPHREGIWVASIVVVAARKVMEMEEAGFYGASGEGMNIEEEFDILNPPKDNESSAPPILPPQRRFTEVRVELPDQPMGIVRLRCVRLLEGGNREVRELEYDMRCQRWNDWARAVAHAPSGLGNPASQFNAVVVDGRRGLLFSLGSK